ncbi:hypothetical protein NIES4072_28020 [Nostoc commune NIES-4072]|uniref:Uncharacterized protein n=1 Tax=Nostoc commune NIES-4072 TaxID=2005467 RepID=A0A2R5FLI7_NOSCO|nr:hypothetical protein [Nostoc commune]BBD69862.1 hypothetical protein NIES4070_62720 [Nostoc commune HK-02]GBG19135.1 hypothetical protein NIES4072_28020 [Nostoc commune NIES-4072]
MKTAEKLAAAWLLTMGFMFVTLSAAEVFNKTTTEKSITLPLTWDGSIEFSETNTPVIDDTTVERLIFGIPSLTLGAWLALGLYRQSRQEKKALNQQVSDRLQSIFYKMLQENHGRITVLGFAMQSQLPAAHARQYLDEKAKDFNANFKVNEEGAVSYHFDV